MTPWMCLTENNGQQFTRQHCIHAYTRSHAYIHTPTFFHLQSNTYIHKPNLTCLHSHAYIHKPSLACLHTCLSSHAYYLSPRMETDPDLFARYQYNELTRVQEPPACDDNCRARELCRMRTVVSDHRDDCDSQIKMTLWTRQCSCNLEVVGPMDHSILKPSQLINILKREKT